MIILKAQIGFDDICKVKESLGCVNSQDFIFNRKHNLICLRVDVSFCLHIKFIEATFYFDNYVLGECYKVREVDFNKFKFTDVCSL